MVNLKTEYPTSLNNKVRLKLKRMVDVRFNSKEIKFNNKEIGNIEFIEIILEILWTSY